MDRYIPEDVRRQIRQECGFGCVICGLAITQYEHIHPPFPEAKVHDPKKMALLCGACHDRVTRGVWSKERVLSARKSPITFSRGFAKDAFDFHDPFDLIVGSNCFRDIRCIIRIGTGEEWFTIEPPEAPDARQRLAQSGANLLKPKKRTDSLTLLLAQYKSPIILILVFACILSFALGDHADALIILAILLLSGLLGFWQERGATNAVAKLLAIISSLFLPL